MNYDSKHCSQNTVVMCKSCKLTRPKRGRGEGNESKVSLLMIQWKVESQQTVRQQLNDFSSSGPNSEWKCVTFCSPASSQVSTDYALLLCAGIQDKTATHLHVRWWCIDQTTLHRCAGENCERMVDFSVSLPYCSQKPQNKTKSDFIQEFKRLGQLNRSVHIQHY